MISTAKSSATSNARSGIGSGVSSSATPGGDATSAVAAPTLELPKGGIAEKFAGHAGFGPQLFCHMTQVLETGASSSDGRSARRR